MIDTEALRSKILTFAMHGELSEQKDSDGAAIPKEMKVELLPESDKPHTIPDNWAWVRINEIISKDLGGGTPSKSVHEYWDNGSIPWATVKDFSSAKNGVLSDTIDHITQNGLDNSASNMADEDAIIVCMRMALGKVVRFSKPMAINQDLRALWLKPFVDQDFFVYYYQTLKIEGRGMTVSGIRKNELMNYPFPVPPLAEQIRIVKIVDELFNVLATIDGLQARYTSDRDVLKGKLIDAAICGKLTKQLPEDGTAEDLYRAIHEGVKDTLPDEVIPFEVPQNWCWTKLGWIMDIERGGSPRPIKTFLTDAEDGINWIKIGDVEKDGKYIVKTKEKIKPEGEKKSRRVYPGDFLLTNSMSFGRPYISQIEGCVHDGWLILRNAKELFDLDFLYYLLSSNYAYNQFCKKASGSTVDNLNIDKVSDAVIPLPQLTEQKRIVEVLNDILQNL